MIYYVATALAFGVGYVSGHRRGYLKALERYIADLRELGKGV